VGSSPFTILQGAFRVLASALLVFSQETDGVAIDGAFKFVASELASEFVGLLLQLQHENDWRAVEFRIHNPATGESGLCGMRLRRCILSRNRFGKKKR
jgi:hypothetical protein